MNDIFLFLLGNADCIKLFSMPKLADRNQQADCVIDLCKI